MVFFSKNTFNTTTMKIFNLSALLIVVMMIFNSCTASSASSEKVQAKVYSNNFTFVAKEFENRLTFSAPAGTGRIAQTNTPANPDESIGIQVTHDKLTINLPSSDQETLVNKYSLNTISEDFTVVRKDLKNGSILVNFFLKDNKDINLIKMEVEKSGKIDCSVEGPTQKPLLYTGYLQM